MHRPTPALTGALGLLALLGTAVAAPAGAAGPEAQAAAPRPTVRDVAQAVGVAATVNDEYGDTAVCDLDGDGTDDWVMGRHQLEGPQVFRGRPDGTMRLVQVLPVADYHGTACFDVVGDARPELVLTVGAAQGTATNKSNAVFRVGAGGDLERVDGALGLADPTGRGRLVEPLDLDGDGRSDDVYLGNAPPEAQPSVNRLARHADGGYTLLGGPVSETTNARCASAGDYDGDGREDLFAGNGKGGRLWRNDGRGGLVDSGTTFPYAEACALVRVDGDRHLDLVTASRKQLQVRLGNGSGGFRGVYSLAVPQASGLAVGDLNADGKADVYVTRARVDDANQPDVLLLGDGTGRFENASGVLPTTRLGYGHSPQVVRAGGRTRVIVLNGGGARGRKGPRQVLEFTP